MRKFLITGGAGFIGSHIAKYLVEKGQEVSILDNFSTGSQENIADLVDKVRLYEADIRNLRVVEEAVSGVDYVLHQAALASVERSIQDPVATNSVNIDGTLNLLVAARDRGVKRVVYAGSSSIYGNSPVLPKQEDMKSQPLSPYAFSKLAGEEYCRIFYSLYGLETVSLRYFNVFGPKQDADSPYAAVIPKFIRLLINGEPPVIYGDGEQSRDFTYIENVVEANVLACHSEDVAGEVINIGCGHSVTVNELAKMIAKVLGRDINPNYTQSPRLGDVRHSLADISRARTLLNYSPIIEFQQGLNITVQWFAGKKIASAIT